MTHDSTPYSGPHSGQHSGQRGMAMITALLASTLMLALGMGLVFSATTDTVTTRVQKVSQQSLSIADAGLAVARAALERALTEQLVSIQAGDTNFTNAGTASTGHFPTGVLVMPDTTVTNWQTYYNNITARAATLAGANPANGSAEATRNALFQTLNGSSYSVTYGQLAPTISTSSSNAANATQSIVLRYFITVTGTNNGGGSATVDETGLVSANVYLVNSASASPRSFSFSGFGAFFDNGDAVSTQYLASGTFSGPVHSNTHFAFNYNNNVVFRSQLTQVDSTFRYDDSSGNVSNPALSAAPGEHGITLSSAGYHQASAVPLPADNFSQEYAVINGTGITALNSSGTPVDPPSVIPVDGSGNPLAVIDSSGKVTTNALVANLRTANDAAPGTSSGSLAQGVYVPSPDGHALSGAGIYVQGDATDIQLSAVGANQVYVIKQGSVTTTITVNPTNNTTSISDGSHSTTFTGVPTDRSDPQNVRPGASLFVNGSINSIRGGYVSGSSGTNNPAIASGMALTVSAQRNITVTGDLNYANGVVNSDGTPVSNIGSITNVLGMFTNDGNVFLAPNASYVHGPGLSLEMDAAVVAFNSNKTNDAGSIEGSITYNGSTSPGSSDVWKLVGSRVQAAINNIGYSTRNVYFDTRFGGGNFAPPFFPGTSYTLGTSTPVNVGISHMDDPRPTGISWFRENK